MRCLSDGRILCFMYRFNVAMPVINFNSIIFPRFSRPLLLHKLYVIFSFSKKPVLAPPKPVPMGTDGHARFNSCHAWMIDDFTGRIIIQRPKSTAIWYLIIHHTFLFYIIGKCFQGIHHTLCGWLIICFLLHPKKFLTTHCVWIINFSWTLQQLSGARHDASRT